MLSWSALINCYPSRLLRQSRVERWSQAQPARGDVSESSESSSEEDKKKKREKKERDKEKRKERNKERVSRFESDVSKIVKL